MKQFTISPNESGQRFDKYLKKLLSNASGSFVYKMLRKKNITLNDRKADGTEKLNAGDLVKLFLSDETFEKFSGKDETNSGYMKLKSIDSGRLQVVYEDDDVIVVNKPQGMVVHPSPGHFEHTLVNALLYHSPLSTINGTYRPGIVHRIDKDTSGLLMVAKNDMAHQSLAKQLKDKTNTREYIALVHGNIKEDSGTIDAPLGRSKVDRKKQAVVKDGRNAVTHFEVLKRYGDYTLVKCVLETGRTHQIRVHMKYIGHPLVGDQLYGPRKTLGNSGQFLHAEKLGFVHPRTNEYLEFTAPLPENFKKLLESLDKR